MVNPVLHSVARAMDKRGMRPALAKLATLGFAGLGRKQRFSVDADGDWINGQPEATFVSPDLLISSYAKKRAEIVDLWCHEYNPQPGDTVIDVGAGVGDETVMFSQMVGPQGRVIAIEAHPQTFACLKKTVARSGLQNVTAIHCAISDLDGTLVIGDDTEGHVANSVITKTAGGVTVPARSLDSLLLERGVQNINLLKMNIEGAERLAILGMDESVSRVGHLVISCHDFIADDGGEDELRTRDIVAAWIEQQGLQVERRSDDPRPWVRYYLYASRADEP